MPLLVDHDAARQVGVVRTLYRSEETGRPVALCHRSRDSAAGWLTRGTPASFAFLPVAESSFAQPGDADHIRTGWITEISVLSPGTKAAEPRAMVTTLLPAEQPKPATATPHRRHRSRRPSPHAPCQSRDGRPRALDAELRRRLRLARVAGPGRGRRDRPRKPKARAATARRSTTSRASTASRVLGSLRAVR